MISGFANDFNIFHNTKKQQLVIYQVFIVLSLKEFKDIVYRHQNMFKAAWIFNCFSHKSIVCLVLLIFLQMATTYPLPQDPQAVLTYL